MSYRVDTDGVDHINVACAGRTMLGLMLHNGAYTPIVHPFFGNFVSIAGLWGWLVTGRRQDVFRHLYGDAPFRSIGNYPVVYEPDLAALVGEAIEMKLHQNLTLMELFKTNKHLPYVSYGDGRPETFNSALDQWVMDDRLTLDQLAYFQVKYACG